MSEATEILKNSNQLHTDFNTAKIFLFDNIFNNIIFRNDTGGEVTLKGGTVVGRKTADGKLKVLASAAGDGSESPVGVVATPEIVLADTTEQVISVCVGGHIAEEKIILDGADTLETNIGGRPIRDLLAAETQGINLVVTDELTGVDNQ